MTAVWKTHVKGCASRPSMVNMLRKRELLGEGSRRVLFRCPFPGRRAILSDKHSGRRFWTRVLDDGSGRGSGRRFWTSVLVGVLDEVLEPPVKTPRQEPSLRTLVENPRQEPPLRTPAKPAGSVTPSVAITRTRESPLSFRASRSSSAARSPRVASSPASEAAPEAPASI
jgi:hypothetical protein